MPANPPATEEIPRLLKAAEAAKVLSCSERTLWSLAQAGKVRCCHIGKLRRFDLPDLLAFIAASKVGGPQ